MTQKAIPFEPGCKVGVLAPASAPRDRDALKKGLDGLVAAGFQIVAKRDSFDANGYLAGDDQARLDELNGFLLDDEPHALICVRGGYGVLRILGQIDFEAASVRPKLLVGYSDITALQLALYKHAGWISVSGPMVAVDWHDPNSVPCRHLLRMTSSTFEGGRLSDDDDGLRPFVSGQCTGTLLGGNLSLITRMIGTPHLPDFSGCILFLEEIEETPYRIDGLLAHLQLAGILDGLAGVVIGRFSEGDVPPGKESLSLTQVFEDYFGDLGIPVGVGLNYGHFAETLAVPIGVEASLVVGDEDAILTLLESPVAGS